MCLRLMLIYCGGCNPVIDRTGFVSEVLAVLRKNYQVELVPKNGVADLAIVVCGCMNACADTTGTGRVGKIISLSGTSIDHLACRKEDLSELVLKEIFNYIG